jgi:EpsD family peptidyl-prolyl cis-trans isomerase
MRIDDPQATLRPFRLCRPARLAILFSILVTASCNQGSPKGQVIAVVNGDEITIAELNEEARARNIVGANDPSVRGALLRDLIDRKLLVQKALKEGLDRNRQHLIAVERMKEVLLAQRLLASVGQGLDAPSQAELQRFIAANPAAFDRRTILSVDQITFPRPSDPALIRRLEAAETLAAIDALLLEAALPRERLVKTWDSAVLPEAVIARLLGLKPGKPFLLPHGNLLIAGEVLSSTAQPMENGQRLRLATERLLAERRNRLMQQTLESVRTDAQISYQSGFSPPPEQLPKAVAPE